MGTDNTTNLGQNSVKSALCVFGALFATTVVAAAVSTGLQAYADTQTTDEVKITVDPACTLTTNSTGNYGGPLSPSNTTTITGSTMLVECNFYNGYAIYAVGYTGDSLGSNVLKFSGNDNAYDIPTGTATSGNTSNWAMTIAKGGVTDSGVIQAPYTGYAGVPDKYTKVVVRGSSSSSSKDVAYTASYQIYAAANQVAGSYTGQVKYTIVCPSGDPAPTS